MEPLLDFMDDTIQLLSDTLNERSFKKALAQLWDKSLKAVRSRMAPADGTRLSSNQSKILYHILSCTSANRGK